MSPRRIVVVGVSGNGKTTLSRRLGARLGVPVTELDALNHQSGWTEASDEDLRRDVEAAMSAIEGWVLDGLYQRKLQTPASVAGCVRRPSEPGGRSPPFAAGGRGVA